MKWLRCLIICLMSFGSGAIFVYLVQGHPIFENFISIIAGSLSFGLVIEVVDMFRGIFRERHEREREKRTKRLQHSHDIKKNVLTRWLDLSVKTVYHIEGFPMATTMKPFYLATWSLMNGGDVWHKWAMQHISHDKGYPNIQNLFEKLETHEKSHNKFVSLLLETLNDEARFALSTFSDLKEYESGMVDNFYFMKGVLYALHIYDVSLKIFDEEELYLGKSTRIAKGDSKIIQKLKGEIESIRAIHEEDFEKIKEGIEEDEQLLNNIKTNVQQIIYELALEKPLKGECDYERSL